MTRTSVWSALCLLCTSLGCVVDNPNYSIATTRQTDGSIMSGGVSAGAAGSNDHTGGTGGSIAAGGNAAGGTSGNATGGASVIQMDAMGPSPDAFIPFGCTMNCPSTVVAATVGDCIYIKAPDPDFCELDTGKGEAAVDLLDSGTESEVAIYLRFEIPSAIRPGTVKRITLELVATDHPYAPAPQSGAIWQVSPFVRSDLFRIAPTKVGTKAIAPDPGPVTQRQIVRWALPPSLFTGGPIFIGVFSTNNDGTNYWNARSSTPPVLLLE
jgi:hypothetical protein